MNNLRVTHRPFMVLCALALVFIGVIASNPALAQRQTLDKVVAIVDEGVVLQSELDRRIEEIKAQAAQTGQALPADDVLQDQIVETLVVESLQLQMANRMGIQYDDDTINSVMRNVAQQNNMSFDQYVSILSDAGEYLATREQIRKELSLRDLQRGVVNRRINITNQEIDNFLNSEMGREALAPEFFVEQTLISVGEEDPSDLVAAKKAFAEEMLAAINAGTDFAQARTIAQRGASENPPTAFPTSGGALGWRKTEDLPSLFVDLVPPMQVGEIIGPVRSPSGFHLIKLVNKRGGVQGLVNQTKARHILITPNEIRTEEQAEALVQSLYERIQNGEDFAEVARQNSDDTASVVAGGDLGWANEGGMPPEFEEQIAKLDIGEVSEPFRTTFGWHIAEVLDRRETDMSREFSRRQAENALRNRKFDVELQNWLLEIREQAYVNILL
ncbi:MAG: peptidylprolyl isomerase [Pseudohongiellaceae bacterium]|nr:peptidylprolyl isomerase [Pseudohongiellaceae bacterium]